MKKLFQVVILLIIAGFTSSVFAENIYTLSGFKIGQNMTSVKNELGNPFKVHKFDDGYVAYIYQLQNYNVIFETNPSRPDLIYAIQIEGKSNPDKMGLGNLNLGDKESKIMELFGKPDLIENAKDEITGEIIPNIKYYDYYNKLNFSIEANSAKVSSIKIIMKPEINLKEKPDYDAFLIDLSKRNIEKYISAFFELHIDNKSYALSKSMFSVLNNEKVFNEAFYGKTYGIVNIKNSDKYDSALRVGDHGMGYVFKITKNGFKYELYFVKSYDGWVLKDLYIDK